MAKPELGNKHQCQNCGAKFFDLNKDPIVCPKCGTVFQGAAAARARPTSKPEEEEAELTTPAGVEVVSLDEVEASEEKAAEPVVDDLEVEEDADADAADDPFLEAEEEDDDDVSNLIDGDIAPDEET
ncbi:MAG TPA: TIGR02300 family protein [Roseiarcus sp.]